MQTLRNIVWGNKKGLKGENFLEFLSAQNLEIINKGDEPIFGRMATIQNELS